MSVTNTKVGIKAPGLLVEDWPTAGESPCDIEACILVDPNFGPGACFDLFTERVLVSFCK